MFNKKMLTRNMFIGSLNQYIEEIYLNLIENVGQFLCMRKTYGKTGFFLCTYSL